MFLRVLKGRKGLFARLSSKTRLPNVLSVPELEQVFHQERARVDRNERVFSLVVFIPADDNPEAVAGLVKSLTDRLRASDTIGQLDAERIGVLLAETDSDGAWKFADNVLERITTDNLNFNCEVYCYPADWGQRDSAGEDESDATRPTMIPRLAGDSRAQMADGRDGLTRIRQGGERPVGDLAPLFVHHVNPLKRTVDILIAGTLLTLLSPLFLVAAIAIKLTSPGPVIFRQLRAGRSGIPFAFYKFRSMYIDAEERKQSLLAVNEAQGPIFKMRNDPRMTSIGRLLRRSSIDELPQLINVLKGDMTLIGPRPPTLDEVPKYELWQRKRLNAKGGLTCIWQVSGRSEIGFDDWVRMDLRYLEQKSFWLDCKLLFKTVTAVLSGRGAY
jgi:lipopolysaccharide/colanic/teichoic acid biosynthesis glycosyltransferase